MKEKRIPVSIQLLVICISLFMSFATKGNSYMAKASVNLNPREGAMVPPNDCYADFEYAPAYCGPNCLGFWGTSSDNSAYHFWEFGDGATAIGNVTDHNYNEPGSYEVCLTITTLDSCIDTYCETVYVGDTINPSDCQALYSWLPSDEPNSIMFMDESTPAPISWHWDFGDGSTSFEPLPVHQYAAPGLYEVCLAIETADGCASTHCEPIIVEDTIVNDCQALYSWLPGDEPNSIMFMDESTPAPISWHWDFGDGSTSFEPLPMHQYAAPGLYEVCLSIETADGCASTHCEPIIVEDTISQNNCEAQYVYYAQNNGSYQFMDNSTGNIFNWYWNFDDGTTSIIQNPSHSFAQPGDYNVCLTVFGADSCINTYCENIQVVFDPNDSIYYSMEGNIHAGNSLLLDGVAILFNTDFDYYSAYDYQLVNDGSFEFNEIIPGNYIVYAIPNPATYPGYFPTYYGDELFWQDAHVINVNANTYDLDIHLIEIDSVLVGEGSLGGTIEFDNTFTYEENIYGIDWFDGGEKLQDGVAAMNIPIFLKNEYNEVLTFCLADDEGNFHFDNLPFHGYSVNAEKASLQAVSPLISLNTYNSAVENVSIQITLDNIYTSVKDEYPEENIQHFKLYPNPVRNNLNIEITAAKGTIMNIEIYSITGKRLKNRKIDLETGMNKKSIDVQDIQPGIYILKAYSGSNSSTVVKFVK